MVNYCPASHEPLWLRTPPIPGGRYRIGDPLPTTWCDLWSQSVLDELDLFPLEVSKWLDEVVSVYGEEWQRVQAPPRVGSMRTPPSAPPGGQQGNGEEEEETVYLHPQYLLLYFVEANEVYRLMFLTQ